MREMKNSGTEWLSDIPHDWTLSNIGSLYTMRNVKVSDRDYPPLSVTMKGVVPQLETAAKTDAHDDRKLVRKGDFAINSRSDRRGSCGIADRDGSVSLINTILAPRTKMNPDYYNWLFHSTSFADEFYRWGHGIVDDLWTTRWQEMKKIDVPVPSYEEQAQIASTLETECTKVDALIANQEAQIVKLKAYKQSLITEVVTKGLDSNVPMKDSGVEWIGEIPKHWRLNRLKYIASYNDESLSEKEPDDLVIRYVEIGSVTLENGITNIEEMQFVNAPSRARRITKVGDVIVSTVRTYLKAIAPITEDGLIVSTGFCVIRPNKSISSKYLEYFTKSDIFSDCVSSNSVGISYPAINASRLMNFYIIEPPEDEQKRIAEYLDQKCSKVDELISIKQQKIEKLNQYKKSLIYEYVTGKKEV
jgi:type I restriction enzyme S subunit